MKLVQQTHLYFQEGKSDKVYEIDLCEVGENEYLVNFRYGRKGSTLREGTKTVFPVSYEEASKVYEKLKTSKTSKGYLEEGETPTSAISHTAQTTSPELRYDKINKYLQQAADGQLPELNWPLSRIIWRAGELRISAATGFMNRLNPADKMERYSLLWALARCGDKSAVQKIKELTDDNVSWTVAKAALYATGDETAQQIVLDEALNQLPGTFVRLIESEDWQALSNQVEHFIFELKTQDNQYLECIYILSLGKEPIRKVICDILGKIPFKPNYFKHIRSIFKAAEMLDDATMFAVISKRFELDKAYYHSPVWSGYGMVDGKYLAIDEQFGKKDSQVAYSSKTREYFKRRVFRWLNKLIDASDGYYTTLATEMLLTYSEQDNTGPFQHTSYTYSENQGRWILQTQNYPPYYQFRVLYAILYKNSDRVIAEKGMPGWRFNVEGDSPPATENREESCPELWDKDCPALVKLLKNSLCEPVQEFATKAFRANPDKSKFSSPELILSLLSKPYEICHKLGIDLAHELYDPDNPNKDLILALIQCNHQDARVLGIDWLEAHKDVLLENVDFTVALIFSENVEVHNIMRDKLSIYPWTAQLNEQILKAIIVKLSLPESNKVTDESLAFITESIFLLFQQTLFAYPIEDLLPIVSSEQDEIKLFVAKVLLQHKTSPDYYPSKLFAALITSESAEVRRSGLVLFGKLSKDILEERKDVLANFCISEYPEIRQEAVGIVKKVAESNAAFSESLINLFLPIFFQREKYEGLHSDLYILFVTSLEKRLNIISVENIWKLIRTSHIPANELGLYILKTQGNRSSLSINEVLELASHELLGLRSFSWEFYTTNVSRIKYESEEAVKMADADWEDSRHFAFEFFDKHFEKEWTPDILIYLCDCNRTEVQQYGKKLITKFFKEDDGVNYMVKLSEHPNTEMQLFVSNYLEKYATRNFERIKKLEYYFTSVLSQLNKGRVSKERVFQFILSESEHDESVAAWFIPFLTRLSLTVSIQDKAHCITILHKLRSQYTHLESPLTINNIPTK